jgi:hypothetical protein
MRVALRLIPAIVAALLATAGTAFAQVCPAGSTCTPLETYIYGQAAATAPYAASLRIPVAPSASASALLYIPLNVVVTLADVQTLTNKTLTAPTIAGGALSGTFSGNPTFSGIPVFSGLSTGTIASGKNLGLDASNNLVVATVSGGAGNVTTGGTLTSNQLVIGSGTTTVSALGSLGTTTTVLHGNAAGAPSFGAVVAGDVSGALAVANLPTLAASHFFAGDVSNRPIDASITGDLGFGTAAAGSVTGTVTGLQGRAVPSGVTTDGQLLIGNTSTGNWNKATLTQGTAVTITNSGGGITIAATPAVGNVSGWGTGVLTAVGTAATGTGGIVLATSASLTTPTITGAALSGTLTGTPTFSGNLTFSGRPIFSGTLTGTQVGCLGLDSGNNLTVAGAACGTSAGATGFGVDGGAASSAVTAGGTIGNTVRLVKIATGWASGTLTLPAISAVSADTCIRIEDGGNFVDGTHTVTVAGNAADAINGGSTGGNTGAFVSPGLGMAFCVTATHNWNMLVSSAIAATTAASHQFFNALSANGVITSAQPSTADVSGLVFSASVGWVATVNPNNATVLVLPANATVTSIVGAVETATGNTSTVSVNKASSGTACSAGTALHSGSFNANGTAATNQTLTVTSSAVTSGQRLCLQTTGTTAWTSGTGIGGITVNYTIP